MWALRVVVPSPLFNHVPGFIEFDWEVAQSHPSLSLFRQTHPLEMTGQGNKFDDYASMSGMVAQAPSRISIARHTGGSGVIEDCV